MVTRQIHTECTRQNVGDASEEGAIKWDRGLRTSRQRERPHKAHTLHPHPRLPPGTVVPGRIGSAWLWVSTSSRRTAH